MVLDSDPNGTVAVEEEKGSAGFDGILDELQIVAEKGQVFVHSVLNLRFCSCRALEVICRDETCCTECVRDYLVQILFGLCE